MRRPYRRRNQGPRGPGDDVSRAPRRLPRRPPGSAAVLPRDGRGPRRRVTDGCERRFGGLPVGSAARAGGLRRAHRPATCAASRLPAASALPRTFRGDTLPRAFPSRTWPGRSSISPRESSSTSSSASWPRPSAAGSSACASSWPHWSATPGATVLRPCERSSSLRRAPPSPARKQSGACSPSSEPQDFPRPSTTSVSTGARSTCSGASRALSSRSTASRSTRPVRHSNATGCETPASLERASG